MSTPESLTIQFNEHSLTQLNEHSPLIGYSNASLLMGIVTFKVSKYPRQNKNDFFVVQI
jgi:hypothetical protein